MCKSLGFGGQVVGRVAFAVCVLISAGLAQAAPLGIGATLFPVSGELDPTGGVPVSACPAVRLPFNSSTFSGFLTSSVLTGDPSNPLGGLTFTYWLENNPTSINVNARLTVNDWTGFLTDASYQSLLPGGPPANAGVRPAYTDRLTADVVGFSFLGAPIGFGPISPGAYSALLVVQTNAPTCVGTIASVIDGTVATVNTYGPAPEPSTLALLGLAGITLIRRRR